MVMPPAFSSVIESDSLSSISQALLSFLHGAKGTRQEKHTEIRFASNTLSNNASLIAFLITIHLEFRKADSRTERETKSTVQPESMQ